MNDLIHTAVHEAGHAVIGRRLGMICGEASIIPDRDSAGHSITADPWVIAQAWESAGKYRSTTSVFLGRILTIMAGAEAEIECLGACKGGDSDDREQVAWMFDSEFRFAELADMERFELQLRTHTRRLVRRHRAAIERVAAELLKRKTLLGNDVGKLI